MEKNTCNPVKSPFFMSKEVNTMQGRNGGTLNVGGNHGGGRPRKMLTEVISQLSDQGVTRVTKRDVNEAFETLMNLNETDLKAIVSDNTVSMLLRIVGKAMLSGKGFDIVEKMLDRTHGKAALQTDVTSGGKPINDFSSLPLEKRLAILKILNDGKEAQGEESEGQ